MSSPKSTTVEDRVREEVDATLSKPFEDYDEGDDALLKRYFDLPLCPPYDFDELNMGSRACDIDPRTISKDCLHLKIENVKKTLGVQLSPMMKLGTDPELKCGEIVIHSPAKWQLAGWCIGIAALDYQPDSAVPLTIEQRRLLHTAEVALRPGPYSEVGHLKAEVIGPAMNKVDDHSRVDILRRVSRSLVEALFAEPSPRRDLLMSTRGIYLAYIDKHSPLGIEPEDSDGDGKAKFFEGENLWGIELMAKRYRLHQEDAEFAVCDLAGRVPSMNRSFIPPFVIH